MLVERALNEGKIAVILFWNPKGATTSIVDDELRLLEAVHHLIRPVAHMPQLRRQLARSGLELEKSFAAFTLAREPGRLLRLDHPRRAGLRRRRRS